MEKQEFKSNWDELVRELGAEIPPETLQREQAVSEKTEHAAASSPSLAEQPTAPARAPLSKRAAADWDSLAGELGLPPVEPAAGAIEEVRREPPREQVSHRTKAEPSQRQRTEQRRPSGRHQQRTDTHRERTGKHRESRSSDAGDAIEPEREARPTTETPPGPSVQTREESARPAAVSLWHKIFGSPAEQSARLTEKTSTESSEPVERTEDRDESSSIRGSGTIRSLSGEDVAAAEFAEDLDRGNESEAAEGEAAPIERKRGQPRRRRRGGRGRKSDERQAGTRRRAPHDDESGNGRELEEEFDDLGELEVEDAAIVPELVDDRNDGIDDGDGALEVTRNPSTSKAAQRTIPTWDEAIGFIVESNMQSRSQRRPPSRSDSRGNSSRGRSRGRRRN